MVTIEAFTFVAYDGKVQLKAIAGRPRDYCEPEGILPEEPCGYRSRRLTIDVMFMVRRLQELPRQDTPQHMCFIDLTKAL